MPEIDEPDIVKIPKLPEARETADLPWARTGWFDIHALVEVR
jgi:hypothetical protein